jgi:tetratricopeptide (TPR) repeat protein
MLAKPSGNILFKLLITLGLMALGGWLVYFNWLQRPIHYRTYTFSLEESKRLKPFARAQYAHGLHAWFQDDPAAAAGFFREAVSQDLFFIDAWLKLAEAEAAMGNSEKSRDILRFTTALTDGVYRWKWPQMLLGRDLGLDAILYRNTNYLLSRRTLTQDALQLLHIHFDGDVTAAMSVLDSDNLALYLSWLMRWGMAENSLIVWQKILKNGKPDTEIGLQYAHFLLDQKRVAESMSVWQEYLSLDGMTNAGFENEITQRGFDWRHWSDENGNWAIERLGQGAHEGNYALRVSFAGRQNISFQNVYQIVPVIPLKRLRLSYAWKSDAITTDQGPFIEIVGYDQNGLSQSGPMITGTHKWREESIEFRPPDGCRAVVVRVRRRPSHRFDSKIKGSFWLDNFRLEMLDSEKNQVLSDKFL